MRDPTVNSPLLASVHAEPDDDTARLVLADWLQEHGDPARAEFIRVQIAQMQLDREDPRQHALRDRESALLKAHERRWRAHLPDWARKLGTFHRGFIDKVTVPAEQFLARGAELLGCLPLGSVQLEHAGPHAPALAACAWLGRVSGLNVRYDEGMTDDDFAALVASPHLGRLKRLDLSIGACGDRALRALAANPVLSGLEELTLYSCAVTAPGVAVLVGSPVVANLRRLDLNSNPLGDDGAAAVARSPHLGRLRSLEMGANRLGDAGARALAGAPALAGLRRLELWMNHIGPEGIRALARAPHLGPLGYLNLDANALGDAGAEALAACPRLGELLILSLQQCGIGADGARRLAESPALGNLVRLALNENPIGPAGAGALAARHWPALCWLGLHNTSLHDEGVAALVRSPLAAQLQCLGLRNNRLGEPSGQALLSWPDPSPLRALLVSANCFVPATRKALKKRFEKVIFLS
ncbi:MAG TPA: TIGR02996 domain-containing protein [Gemmata sp.]